MNRPIRQNFVRDYCAARQWRRNAIASGFLNTAEAVSNYIKALRRAWRACR